MRKEEDREHGRELEWERERKQEANTANVGKEGLTAQQRQLKEKERRNGGTVMG